MKALNLALWLLATTAAIAQDIAKGVRLYDSGSLNEAEIVFSSIKKNHPEIIKATYYLGRISFDKQEYKKSMEYFEDLVELDDTSSDYYHWLGNATGMYAQESNVIKQGFLAPKAKDAYEKAVELDNQNIDAHMGLVEFYTLAPGFLGGSWEKAELSAEAIKNIDKAAGHQAMGTVYERQEQYDLAEREYIEAATLDKSRLVSLAFFYQSSGKYTDAFEMFERAYEKDSTNYGALYQIGRTSALSGEQPEKGIKALRNYLKVSEDPSRPSHAGALWRLGMIYEKDGDETSAIACYERSLLKDPDQNEAKKALSRLK